MIEIEVDEEVFQFLERAARPFEEHSPNDVLRRLLLPGKERKPMSTMVAETKPQARGTSSTDFMKEFLEFRFGKGFRSKAPYRTMFESDDAVVYFQNFNKPNSPNLWYRLRASAIEDMRRTRKAGFVCLTNPAERLAYVLPLAEIVEQAKRAANWSGEDDLEVNIDHANGRWRELDWPIEDRLTRLE